MRSGLGSMQGEAGTIRTDPMQEEAMCSRTVHKEFLQRVFRTTDPTKNKGVPCGERPLLVNDARTTRSAHRTVIRSTGCSCTRSSGCDW